MSDEPTGAPAPDDDRFLYACLQDWTAKGDLRAAFKDAFADYLLYRFQLRYREPNAGRFLQSKVRAMADWHLDPDLRERFSGSFTTFLQQRA